MRSHCSRVLPLASKADRRMRTASGSGRHLQSVSASCLDPMGDRLGGRARVQRRFGRRCTAAICWRGSGGLVGPGLGARVTKLLHKRVLLAVPCRSLSEVSFSLASRPCTWGTGGNVKSTAAHCRVKDQTLACLRRLSSACFYRGPYIMRNSRGRTAVLPAKVRKAASCSAKQENEMKLIRLGEARA